MTTISAPIPLGATSRPLELRQRLHGFAKTMLGRVMLVGVFTMLLLATRPGEWKLAGAAGAVLALTSLFPAKRKVFLTFAAIGWIFLMPPLLDKTVVPGELKLLAQKHSADGLLKFWPVVVAGVLAFGFGYTALVRRFPKSIIGRRPIVGLLLVLVALYTIQPHVHGVAWFAVAMSAIVLCHYLWFFAYTISDSKLSVQPRFWRPFWAVNKCPMGKGAGYLERVEAKDDDQLAVVQLKAIRLIAWCLALTVLRIVLASAIYGPNSESQTKLTFLFPSHPLPTYPMALDAHVAGHPYPVGVRWLALMGEFLFGIMVLSIWGHKAIAILRMAGFNAFRNTYRPFTATTISEFFNRYHWYFKELLANFFFYPTYLRYFKKWPKVRLVAATVASAGVGNFLFHFFVYDRNLLQHGFWNALWGYRAYAVYVAILSTGISISQLRLQNRKRKTPAGVRKFFACVTVLSFFFFLTIFDESSVTRNISDYAGYFLSLFHL